MADRPDAYVRKDPGDIIRSGDWNELQIRTREDIRGHKHTGKDDGTLIPRAGIEANAIDGSRIDPTADVTVKTLTTGGNLTVKGDLTVNGKQLLGDIADLLSAVKSKLDRAGDTVTGTLNIQKLNVLGALQVNGGIYNAQNSRIIQTDAADWLRINPDSKYPGIALYKSIAIGEGGMAIGEWSQPPKGNLKVTGLITASSSSTPPVKDANGVPALTSGIRFLDNPGGGGADAAWIQYYARSGEACTLEIGVSNDGDDHIALMPSGNVGIGTTAPQRKLQIGDDVNGLSFDGGSTPNAGAFRFGDATGWKLHFGLSRPSPGAPLYSEDKGILMTIKDNGNVGIGTITPDARLTVSGGDIYMDNATKIYNRGRMHIHGEELLYLLNKSGVIIGKEWGGNGNLTVEGGIKSPMWNVTQVFNSRQGGLPLTSGAFTTGGGSLLIIASGSGWGSGNIGMSIQLDGGTIGTVRSFTNEGGSHKAFTCNPLVQRNIAAGSHTITLTALAGTSSDGNDWFNVTVLEFPF